MSDSVARLRLPPLTRPMTRPLAPRTWWPDPDAWVAALAHAHASGEPPLVGVALEGLGAPALDVLVTQMSARAALLGVATGRAFAHHELRRRIPMPEALEPELPVWEHGTVPVWLDGVLTEPKYFSFFQDAPLPVFHPNHRRKWRAHELLHGAVGWFWRPDMTPFEAYVGARLNELLPVVHWYTLDEIFRPACPRHQGRAPRRELCAACEAAATPFWTRAPLPSDRARSLFVGAREHLADELEAISAEIATGRAHPTPRPGLDASSDAIGYLRGHWNRMTSWSFGAWVEMFCAPGVDHVETLDVAAGRVAATSAALISGEVACDVPRASALRARRAAQDLGYRSLLMLEWLDDSSALTARVESLLLPALEALASGCARVLSGEDTELDEDLTRQVLEVFEVHEKVWPGGLASDLAHTGVGGEGDIEQVRQGVVQALPRTASEATAAEVAAFVRSPHFGQPGWLCDRWAAWRSGEGFEDAEVVALEAWLVVPEAPDRDAELFGAIPQDVGSLSPGALRVNTTLRRRRFGADAISALLPQMAGAERELFAARFRGDVRVGEVTEEVARAFEGGGDPQTLEALLLDGVLVFEPLPQVLP